jgi:small subunit ribosomal protein S6
VTEDHTNVYEGLFLFPQTQSGNLQPAVDLLTDILSRAKAEVIALGKWEERRLAYEIKGNKRGVYFLVYFRAPGSALAGIERACNLSELLLRSMIIRADHVTPEQMEAADGTAELADEIKLREAESAPAEAAAKPAPQASRTDETRPAEPVPDKPAPAVEATEPITVETETPAKDPATTLDG